MIVTFSGWLGESRRQHPMSLPDGVGVRSLNQKPGRGDLRPWNAPLVVATVPAGRKTIYRMGLDTPSDTLYWLSTTGIAHFVRGANAVDAVERTYFTGDGAPKVTDNVMGLASAPYPTTARILGVPAPVTAATVTASGGAQLAPEFRQLGSRGDRCV